VPPALLTVTESTEAAWTRAAQAGDPAAFGHLYQRYTRMVHGILLAYVRYHEAEDLVQEVFLTALRRLDTLREAEAVGAWLATIARNVAHDQLRRRKPWVELLDRFRHPDSGRLEALAVLAEIQKLPTAYRETLILRLIEGMTGPEIASRTGLTPDSVRVNLSRGMKLLREKLEVA
jgi:RNA polymerase sigma-70 factor, ECF subfamily